MQFLSAQEKVGITMSFFNVRIVLCIKKVNIKFYRLDTYNKWG